MSTVWSGLKRFHQDETGAPEMSNVLIVALIAIPLVIALIVFGRWAYNSFVSAQQDLGAQEVGDTGSDVL